MPHLSRALGTQIAPRWMRFGRAPASYRRRGRAHQLYLWQTSFTEMQAFPQRFPFLQLGPPAAIDVDGAGDAMAPVEAGAAAVAGVEAVPHIVFFAILPLASWQLPLASSE